jgi:hypothetical protein
MSIGPKKESSTLDQWMDVIEKVSKKSREDREKLRTERCEFLRNYFNEKPTRIQDLGPERLIRWVDSESGVDHEVILNSRFANTLLANDKALEVLWEEIARRASFDIYLMDMAGIPIPAPEEEISG